MVKWFAYIVLLLMLAPHSSFAKKGSRHLILKKYDLTVPVPDNQTSKDTSETKHQQELDEKKKIKEIAKAKRQPKPEKLGTTDDAKTPPKPKPKRQRRPEGLERPPEIPRRNGN
ncbi:hypothetical protein SAMN05216490_0446 [Mucilaginibacter mallensis]|uniref:Uncharacterized protein n=1 Tax=Mucilaginibacter mallensis TaxID=652787 RepID=A0A1H1P1G5_MUCMA|nr:hypothetical protein [Mucilaginibacter mallensis]SDS05071.1 hypothetical protein SAMN05216490_0446 [Mucilaginibacter mallensis]